MELVRIFNKFILFTDSNVKKIMEKKKTLGLVLSGGGSRGFAHLGILSALEEMDVKPDIISGTSAGAVAGVLYASGYKPKEIVDILMERNFIRYAEFTKPNSGGLMRLTGLYNLLNAKIRKENLEDLDIPVYVCATDMNNGKSVYFSSGAIVERVVASASIPVIFQLVNIDGVQYADGGILNNLPTDPLIGKADILFGISVTSPSVKEDLGSLFQVAERSFHLGITANVMERANMCDHYIQIPELIGYNLLKSSHGEEIYDIGYMKAMQYFRENPGFQEFLLS